MYRVESIIAVKTKEEALDLVKKFESHYNVLDIDIYTEHGYHLDEEEEQDND